MNRRDTLKLILAASGSSLLSSRNSAGEVFAAFSNAPSSPATPSSKGAIAPVFTWLTLGEVKPAGWIKEQMVRDLNQGFAGHLDELCHEAASDIFVSHRNGSAAENTGNIANNNWWNGETEGNWRAGFIMMAYLTEDKKAMQKADDYVRHILSSQGDDGYLGVFAPAVRFKNPGELWTQTCLLRGLLDYCELTGNQQVMQAIVRATDLTMSAYGSGKTPFPYNVGTTTVGGEGLSHDIMISDVMERLYDLTGDEKYRDFTLSFYLDVSRNASNADTSLPSLLNLNSGYVGHGANTYETIRVPFWLWMATGREDLGRASRNALDKLNRYTEPSGSAISQENVSNLKPDPTLTQYEYCGTKEIQFSLESALQKTGVALLGDQIEQIWFNAAQASRLADGTAITYLTTDNRLHCDGLAPDGVTKDRSNKFSPTQADVAVCCNPNATAVAALYVRGMWMRHASGGLAAVLYGPCTVSTSVRDTKVRIEERTHYPFENTLEFTIQPERDIEFPLFFRDPAWSKGTTVTCANANIVQEGGYWIVKKKWQAGDNVRLNFVPTIREVPAVNGEVALQYGALLFAQPIAADKKVVKTYPIAGFADAYFLPTPGKYNPLSLPASRRWQSFGLQPTYIQDGADPLHPFDQPLVALKGNLLSQSDGSEVSVLLVPIGNAPVLRRVTFPISS
jgi:uncharacterized protein